ncbi:MAG: c-type cytochrome [Planctomycetes bacterium]|nr:c-type cytochrome [Planctomycetota bacterium]
MPEILADVTNGQFDELAERNLADVYPGVPSPAPASKLLRHLQTYSEDRDTTARYVRHVARYLAEDQLDSLYTFTRNSNAAVDTEQLRHELALMRAMREGMQDRGGMWPDELTGKVREWAVALARSLFDTKQPASVNDAIELARTMKLEAIESDLVDIAAGKTLFRDQRQAAITALAAINPGNHLMLLSDILGRASEPLPLRQHVATVLGSFNQAPAQDLLVERLHPAPEQLGVYIAAALAASGPGAEKLLGEVAAGKASPRLLQHPLVSGKLEAAKLPNLKERLAKLTEGLPPADMRLQQIIDQRRSGFASAKPDPQQGAKIYQKHCANCHALGGSGAKVGPQLDGISGRGLDRILEDVLDPNRNVDQAFRSSVIALKNGQVLTGLVLADEAERLVLADSEGKQVIVPKGDIEEWTRCKLSPMPANVADLVPEEDFYHLLSYLLAQPNTGKE